jgi:hypothetical protein
MTQTRKGVWFAHHAQKNHSTHTCRHDMNFADTMPPAARSSPCGPGTTFGLPCGLRYLGGSWALDKHSFLCTRNELLEQLVVLFLVLGGITVCLSQFMFPPSVNKHPYVSHPPDPCSHLFDHGLSVQNFLSPAGAQALRST